MDLSFLGGLQNSVAQKMAGQGRMGMGGFRGMGYGGNQLNTGFHHIIGGGPLPQNPGSNPDFHHIVAPGGPLQSGPRLGLNNRTSGGW